jgi:hypothetical protein
MMPKHTPYTFYYIFLSGVFAGGLLFILIDGLMTTGFFDSSRHPPLTPLPSDDRRNYTPNSGGN